MEHCKFRVMDKCKNEECELLMCMEVENCIHFQPESKEKLEDTIPKWKIDNAIEEIKQCKVYGHTDCARLVSLPEVLTTLKRNIGE